MQYTVFGANGYIGSYIFKRFMEEGYPVTGTGRRAADMQNLVFFDIQTDTVERIIPKTDDEDRTAIICIAETNIDRCWENYSQAYEINVIRTKKMIRDLRNQGMQVIFFSSDNVFDGKEGNYSEESPTNAINKYGQMKAEMEKYLLKNEPEVCIFRIPKVVSPLRRKQNIFTEWEERSELGMVRCIRGNRISFVSVEDIYHACVLAAEKRLHGLYNVVGDQAYSRAELARKFYDKFLQKEIKPGLEIIECEAEEFSFKDSRPLDVSMNNLKFRTETGYQFMSMDTAIEKYINNLKENVSADKREKTDGK